MTKKIRLLCMLMAVAGCTACDKNHDEEMGREVPMELEHRSGVLGFAADDGGVALVGSPAEMVRQLLVAAGPSVTKGMGELRIGREEYMEIKAFTSQLVKDCKTDMERHEKVFRWLYKNLKYVHEYESGESISNDAYAVFKTRRAICQGFANLLHVMLESQGVGVVNVNGQYVGVGGHAWNYVYMNGEWWVSDATNNGYWRMSEVKKYKHLQPASVDAKLYEDGECVCTYRQYHLNVDEIKSHKGEFVVPFSVLGYRVTSVCPTKKVPDEVKRIAMHRYVVSLGEYYKGLEKNAPSVEYVSVEEGNRMLEGYEGAVYKKNGEERQLEYVPGSMRVLQLLPMRVVDKNTVFMHDHLEEVVIGKGTKRIGSYAFEKCPRLRVAYVPEETRVEDRAFYGVDEDFQIIRGEYTCIDEVTI